MSWDYWCWYSSWFFIDFHGQCQEKTWCKFLGRTLPYIWRQGLLAAQEKKRGTLISARYVRTSGNGQMAIETYGGPVRLLKSHSGAHWPWNKFTGLGAHSQLLARGLSGFSTIAGSFCSLPMSRQVCLPTHPHKLTQDTMLAQYNIRTTRNPLAQMNTWYYVVLCCHSIFIVSNFYTAKL